jgi:hypothetical protein
MCSVRRLARMVLQEAHAVIEISEFIPSPSAHQFLLHEQWFKA